MGGIFRINNGSESFTAQPNLRLYLLRKISGLEIAPVEGEVGNRSVFAWVFPSPTERGRRGYNPRQRRCDLVR